MRDFFTWQALAMLVLGYLLHGVLSGLLGSVTGKLGGGSTPAGG